MQGQTGKHSNRLSPRLFSVWLIGARNLSAVMFPHSIRCKNIAEHRPNNHPRYRRPIRQLEQRLCYERCEKAAVAARWAVDLKADRQFGGGAERDRNLDAGNAGIAVRVGVLNEKQEISEAARVGAAATQSRAKCFHSQRRAGPGYGCSGSRAPVSMSRCRTIAKRR